MNTSLNKKSSKLLPQKKAINNLLPRKTFSDLASRNYCNYQVLIYIDCLQGYGADKVLVKLANGLADQGIKVDLIVSRRKVASDLKIRKSINIKYLNSSRFNPIKNIIYLSYYIFKYKPEIVISSIHFNNIVATCALYLSRQKTKLILRQANVLEEQFKDYPFPVSLILRYLLKLAYKNANLLIAPSQAVALDMKKYLKAKKQEIKVIYNPTVTPDIFEKAQQDTNHEWFQKNYPIILSVGRLKPQKDFQTLLKAFAKVKQNFKQAKLVILGEGFQREELTNLAIQLGIDKEVDLAGYKKNPYPFISKANVFVSSSRYEGLPNVIIEAFALGKKIVATDIGGSAEILKNGLYGELVPVGNEDLMAEAIERALVNQSSVLREPKSKYIFNQTEQVNKYIDTIQELVND